MKNEMKLRGCEELGHRRGSEEMEREAQLTNLCLNKGMETYNLQEIQ